MLRLIVINLSLSLCFLQNWIKLSRSILRRNNGKKPSPKPSASPPASSPACWPSPSATAAAGCGCCWRHTRLPYAVGRVDRLGAALCRAEAAVRVAAGEQVVGEGAATPSTTPNQYCRRRHAGVAIRP